MLNDDDNVKARKGARLGRGLPNRFPHFDDLEVMRYLRTIATSTEEYKDAAGHHVVRFRVDLDAKDATFLLGFNERNRNPDKVHVARIAAAMESGDFEDFGQPIIIGRRGLVIDGQHRLNALAEAGKRGFVWKNAVVHCSPEQDEDAIAKIDTTQKPRSLRNALQILGSDISSTVISGLVIEQHEFNADALKQYQVPQRIRLAEQHPHIVAAAAVYRASPKPKPVVGEVAAVVRCMAYDEELASEFFGALFSGDHRVGGTHSEAVRTLHAWRTKARGSRPKAVSAHEWGYRYVRMFRAHLRDEKISKLYYSASSTIPSLP